MNPPVPNLRPALADLITGLSQEELRELREHLVATNPDPPRRVWGWGEIALELGIGETSAKEHGRRERDPLPWEDGHRGVWAYATALRDWARRQNVPGPVRLEVVRLRRQARQAQTAKARAALAKKRAQGG